MWGANKRCCVRGRRASWQLHNLRRWFNWRLRWPLVGRVVMVGALRRFCLWWPWWLGLSPFTSTTTTSRFCWLPNWMQPFSSMTCRRLRTVIQDSLPSFKPKMPGEAAGRLWPTRCIQCKLALVIAFGACAPNLITAQISRGASSPAGKVAGNAPWSSLSADQRVALAPLEREWSGIDAPRRSKWLEIAAKYPSMPPDEQLRMQERMKEWARMTPTERGHARLSYQGAKQLAPQERQAQWEAYQALPEANRRALAATASGPATATPRRPPTSGSAAASAAAPSGSGTLPALSGQVARPLRPITPTLIQGGPGATTTPISRAAAPPAHQQPGQPRIAAAPGQVDRATLLPSKTGQAAAQPGGSGSSAPKKSP